MDPVAAAELSSRGHSKHVLAGRRWRRTSRGFYVPAAELAPTPTQRIIEAMAIAPRGGVLGGWAAAYVVGVDQLDGLDDFTRKPLPVPVFLPHGLHRHSLPNIRYLQQRLGPDDVLLVAGLPSTTRVRTALDLARWAPNVIEAVVALDAMMQAKAVTTDTLEQRVGDCGGRRGFRQAVSAVKLCRLGVRSSWESRLRMLYVLDLGFPSPEVNVPVFDLSGRFVGAPDLLDVDAGLAMEYDGAAWTTALRSRGHLDPDQHREDNVREELLERTGLIVSRAVKKDLTHYRRRLLGRIAAARADGLGRHRSRDRWTLEPPEGWLGLPA
jgi:hypothetical protein